MTGFWFAFNETFEVIRHPKRGNGKSVNEKNTKISKKSKIRQTNLKS